MECGNVLEIQEVGEMPKLVDGQDFEILSERTGSAGAFGRDYPGVGGEGKRGAVSAADHPHTVLHREVIQHQTHQPHRQEQHPDEHMHQEQAQALKHHHQHQQLDAQHRAPVQQRMMPQANSIAGASVEWKNAQKNDTNNMISDNRNNSKPTKMQLLTRTVRCPPHASRRSSRHHWNATTNRKAAPEATPTSDGRPWNQDTNGVANDNTAKEPSSGHAPEEPEGWLRSHSGDGGYGGYKVIVPSDSAEEPGGGAKGVGGLGAWLLEWWERPRSDPDTQRQRQSSSVPPKLEVDPVLGQSDPRVRRNRPSKPSPIGPGSIGSDRRLVSETLDGHVAQMAERPIPLVFPRSGPFFPNRSICANFNETLCLSRIPTLLKWGGGVGSAFLKSENSPGTSTNNLKRKKGPRTQQQPDDDKSAQRQGRVDGSSNRESLPELYRDAQDRFSCEANVAANGKHGGEADGAESAKKEKTECEKVSHHGRRWTRSKDGQFSHKRQGPPLASYQKSVIIYDGVVTSNQCQEQPPASPNHARGGEDDKCQHEIFFGNDDVLIVAPISHAFVWKGAASLHVKGEKRRRGGGGACRGKGLLICACKKLRH
ncbi:hypothetical protein BDK51DRAFT_34143 [Blyttiomyces helicus]|uniref:Uncharacterized protein n=1 Tax=Blyttiomyces helicus TaxID=388810 RepID=A0A4P9WJK4_9FUNG|nr:hypothetical protein BDK51DRAFT_34143 [Blyttiomyces helicus]|eukprot:RKO92245.1 hypothetical protein BDK51DRAFT_34143 [Blyttiomyces helicus]